MSFRQYTDDLIKDAVRILFWVFIIFGNLYFWFDINLFQYITPLWLK